MKRRLAGKFLVVLLSLGMVFSTAFPLGGTVWADATDSVWTALDDIDAAAESEQPVAITMEDVSQNYAGIYALTATTSDAGPIAEKASLNSEGELVIAGEKNEFGWTVIKTENEGAVTYTLQNSDGKYLYVTATNNGVRVGDKPATTGGDWTLTGVSSSGGATLDYLSAEASDAVRFLGVYQATNWRCYKLGTDGSFPSNIKDQTLKFWKYDRDEAGEEMTVTDISTVLEANSGEFMVKGVVTLIDASNLYVQDATGGICVRCAAAPSEVAVGDTIIGTGTRGDYNGLPQLNNSDYSIVTDPAEMISLEAAETTIGALTTSDICKYVTIKDLTVDSVDGTNVNVKDANGDSIQIYKAVLGDTVLKAGDEIIFTGAVGVYKTNLQLRNTLASEIVVKSEPQPEGPFTVTVEASENGTVTASKTEDIEAGEEITITVTPAEGYDLDKLLVNGEEVAVGEDGTAAVAITKDTTVSATFKEKEPETSTIAEALAGATNEEFTVKGVVTFIDGRNIYIQDATGGICLFFDVAPNGISLGDTIIGSGKRAVYRGLPELSGATFTKSSGLKLTPKETTIAGLSETDICTYISIKGLEVTDVSGDNTTLKDANGNTIVLYKGVAADALEVGTVIDFKGALGIYNTTKQLRNTLASEISFKSDEGLVTDISNLSDGSYVVIYNPASGLSMTSDTYRDWYLFGESTIVEDNKVIDPAAKQVWKVTVNSDGTYSFTQEGSLAVAGWLSTSGSNTYVELTSNALQEGADTSWEISPSANEENHTFYMKSKTLSAGHGSFYIEVYNKSIDGTQTPVFCGYDTSEDKLTEGPYGMQFYVVPKPDTPDPGEIGDLITDLSQLEDGTTVAIYSPSRKTAISSVANGDWYLKAKAATITTEGKLDPFTTDYIWKVKVNSDGTYSFYSYDNEADSITVWPSFTRQWYAELTVNTTYNEESVNTWNVQPAGSGSNAFTIASAELTDPSGETSNPAYIRANSADRFAGSFVANPSGTDYALQFYKVDPEDAVADFDDGEWDGVLEKGAQYVIYNEAADAVLGLFKEANHSYDAVPTEFTSGTPELAVPGNGAYAFTVDSMGRYYTFKVGDKYMASNNEEELYLEDEKDGVVPGNAKWYLEKNQDGYVIYNKEANYKGSAVCIEYFSSVFSGWTFKSADADIFRFKFYKVDEGSFIHENVVQVPTVIFDCENFKYVDQDFHATITLEDLCPEIVETKITYTVGGETGEITDYTVSSDKKNYTFVIPAEDLDKTDPATGEYYGNFDLAVEVTNGFGNTYTESKPNGVGINDLPFFEDLTPAPGSQTGEDLKPVISAKVRNAGEGPEITMKVNDEEIEDFIFEDGVVSYKPAEELEGKTTVQLQVKRTDGMKSIKNWSFTAGISDYQLYFGQLHSHTTYSDGSGSLDAALDYIASLPESANIQFVAFTDHSNYFDTVSAANPADAVNDKELMTPASKALWEEYKGKVAAFNAKQNDVVAIGGFEMTWSGGPGHINTFDSDGLVSRNNAELNNKTDDAGMKLYYKSINKGDSMNQFNHPGNTFGNFTDFSYWDEETDDHMFLVEVGNGEGQIGQGGYYPSYEQYIMALDKGWHLAPTNNQDNHKGLWGNANDARDVVLTNNFSEQGIYEAIRERRIYATEDKNLQISYTVNGEPMGHIFEETPQSLSIDITNYDPDNIDLTKKVELVANGGKVVKTWADEESITKGIFTAEIKPEDSYYFVRITQSDDDIAVTAPVWVGKGISAGIEKVTAPETAIVDTDTTLTTSFFNNEGSAANVKSITYTTDGSRVLGTDTKGYALPANGTVDVPFTFKPDTAKRMTITVTAVVEINGTEQTYTKDVILSVRENAGPLEVSPIAEVQAQTEEGFEYAIEGVVTSNASGYDKDTAFFDCIYVQDDTAGICCFPVSGEYKIGDKVHIEGYTDFYQGEAELQVATIEVIGEGSITPTEVTAAQINDQSVLGSLVTLKGTVESFEEANGLIQTIMVKDANGDVARVFIDGYITTGNEVEGCEVGAEISATGLASYDDTFNAPEGPFPRIRIRNRADIVCGGSEPSDIESVIEAVDALPEEVTVDDEAAIADARSQYDALSEEDKAALPKETKLKLEVAEAKLTAAKAQAAAAAAQAGKDKAEAAEAAAEAEKKKAEASAATAKADKRKAEAAAAAAEAAKKAAEDIANGSAAEADRAKAALALASAVIDAVGVDTGKYQASTVDKFKKALDAAKKALKNNDATTAELNKANAGLAKASGGLVLKVKNPMTVKAKTVKIKASKLKKKTRTVTRKKVFTIKKRRGKVTYKKVSGNKKITINKKTGKVTIKKGLKKGTYKVKVKVTASGNGKYKKTTKTRTFKIRVK